MVRAWTFPDAKQKAKHGPKAKWSVGWLNPEGKRRSKVIGSKSMAEKFARRIEGELAAGVYRDENRVGWQQFRTEFEAKIMSGMEPGTRESTKHALDHFERTVSP